MHEIAHVQRAQIDLDELGQILRQARDFDIGQRMRNPARPPSCRRRRLFLIEEVQRHADADHLVLIDALEVQMQQLLLERMALHIAQQDFLRFAVELEIENGRIEPFVVRRQQYIVVHELDAGGSIAAAIDNRRHLCRHDAGGGSHPSRRLCGVPPKFHESLPFVVTFMLQLTASRRVGNSPATREVFLHWEPVTGNR